jgi:hypothetical protein
MGRAWQPLLDPGHAAMCAAMCSYRIRLRWVCTQVERDGRQFEAADAYLQHRRRQIQVAEDLHLVAGCSAGV